MAAPAPPGGGRQRTRAGVNVNTGFELEREVIPISSQGVATSRSLGRRPSRGPPRGVLSLFTMSLSAHAALKTLSLSVPAPLTPWPPVGDGCSASTEDPVAQGCEVPPVTRAQWEVETNGGEAAGAMHTLFHGLPRGAWPNCTAPRVHLRYPLAGPGDGRP